MFRKLTPITALALLATASCDLSPQPPRAAKKPSVAVAEPSPPAKVREATQPEPPPEFGAGRRLIGNWEMQPPGDEAALSLMKITFEFAPEGELVFCVAALGKTISHQGKWKCLKDQGDEIVLELRADAQEGAPINISDLFSQGEAQQFKILDADHMEMSPLADAEGESPLKFKRIAATAEPLE